MTPTLLWRTATRTHDWTTRESPLRLLEAWCSLGLVTAADWVEGSNGRRRKAALPVAEVVRAVRTAPVEADGRLSVRYGGRGPREWTLTVLVFPRATGMSLFNLTAGGEEPVDAAASGRLAQAFRGLYTPDTADAAYLHADPQWTMLAGGPYKPPLVTTPTFAGVFWANFLGPGHLPEFDLPKLKAVSAHQLEWQGDAGLTVVATPTLPDALAPDGERELLRLTAEFRAAKAAD